MKQDRKWARTSVFFARAIDRAAVTIATVLGAGYASIAPGTCGTAAAVGLAWALAPLAAWAYAVVTLAVALIGVAAAQRAQRVWHERRSVADVTGRGDRRIGDAHDDQRIVIDEVAGYLVTMLPADRTSGWALAAGFVVFRALDITKPPPVRALERLPGGWGVVADDVGAGVMGAILMLAIGCFGVWGTWAGI